MKAMIENGVVTALVTGDVDCGVVVPAGTPVSAGWAYKDDTFSAPAGAPVTQDTATRSERLWRTARLSESDWLVSRHRDELDAGSDTSLSSKQFSRLLAYRQALRDWPVANDTTDAESRPQPPKWLARISLRPL
ncbi:phage tail assembly chaperone [Pseudomonas sp. MG-9]|uniref:Phage tail assembly chaperone n=1 Tax=Pseudomonas serboccidentalis TaxID=2964670 RepID=A0ABY7ZCQ0_9PSED|nr:MULTISPECIES: phage tail assembly chaperone [Pseudomonas]MBT9266035.1 phage tail assembly chaperone [Pseudomonas sp. MG-9]WDR36593.1 phage tail assembly chaperone [Pseudomonas serboccidentalis]